jgi:hypothetical protein
MTIDRHPLWPDLQPLVRVSTYDRDGGHQHPRHRMEVRHAAPTLREQLLQMEVECAACGRMMRPVRSRQDGSTFLNVACELQHKLGCARSGASHREYERLVALVLNAPPTPTPADLF